MDTFSRMVEFRFEVPVYAFQAEGGNWVYEIEEDSQLGLGGGGTAADITSCSDAFGAMNMHVVMVVLLHDFD